MATYTDNYSLTKPTFAEVADIRTINGNMDTIDDIMHASQVSLAEAYDQTETYNKDDVVMYEMLMYKCKADNVTGNWDATKWERTTASECGASTKLIGVASGNPASFPDGSDNPLEACNVDINPVQDLHGYDKPWAGGAGKNQAEGRYTWNINANGVIIESSSYATCIVKVSQGTTYTFSVDGVKAQIDVIAYFTSYPQVGSTSYNNSRETFIDGTFTAPITGYATIRMSASIGDMMVENGSSASSYEPYSNICPITPRTEVNITVSATQSGSGEDTQIAFGRNVYGGTLNVKTGELTVDKAIVTFNGSENWQIMTSAGYPYAFRLDGSWGAKSVRVGTKNAISNIWDYSLTSFTDHGFRFADNNGDILYIYERLFEGNLNGFKAFLNTNNMQMVYNLATPLTYTLTGEEVRSILGQNYIEADSGEITVAYVRDLNSCISNIISRIEALEQANSNRSLSLNRSLSKGTEEPQEEPSEEVEEEPKEETKEEPEVKEEENNEANER